MAAGTALNAWTADFINTIIPAINTALAYWSKRNSTTERVTNDKYEKGSRNAKTKTVPFTFDQKYATTLLNSAVDSAASARVKLVNLLSIPEINPATANGLLSSFDKAFQPLADFQKNTNLPVPNSVGQALFDWYLKNLRSILISLGV
jgi:hypothetical protein